MSSLEGVCRAWLMLLGQGALALTVMLGWVLLARPAMRRWFGAERAAWLWWLPAVGLVASVLPHPALLLDGHARLPTFMVIRSVTAGLSRAASDEGGVPWAFTILLVWSALLFVLVLRDVTAQRRYTAMVRNAQSYEAPMVPVHVRLAQRPDAGPAVVGVWRKVVLLPSDFEQRFAYAEQAIVLAHESMHAERRDGLWLLLARIITLTFWFHPLAWWALSMLRRDLELACDAAVLRQQAPSPRLYAQALLKSQPAPFALPAGCCWSSRHPLMERITMLKSPTPSSLTRRIGAGVVFATLVAGAGWAYAATTPLELGKSASPNGHEYQLDMVFETAPAASGHRHAERSALAICTMEGEQGVVRVGTWSIVATPTPVAAGQLQVQLSLRQDGAPLAQPRVIGALGKSMRVTGTTSGAQDNYVLDLTPRMGCPARESASRAAP
ncbi:M56 family metallopeptidase [Dyella sp. ASV21]|uniref:M56 family metallopeptidase n=1 Tax=Dyella sp. ASV21 TaxID=2795114 RepID=UPI0018EB0B00|nr:M56 family metallopeptidase [Dyella sp. ASV21]